jgi:hypothetical protein
MRLARPGFATALVLLLAFAPGSGPGARAQADMAARIQGKIARVGEDAIRLREAGGDVAPVVAEMQTVGGLLQRGRPEDAERRLDALLTRLGTPPADAAVIAARDCDPAAPMTVSETLTITQDCTVGGDLVVRGDGVLHVDYSARPGGRMVVAGNVIVQDQATLSIEGRPEAPASFAIDNTFSDQRRMESADAATIRLAHVVFRTQAAPGPGKGSVYMTYRANDRSAFEAIDAALEPGQGWLLGELHDDARLLVTDSRHVPTEIYVRDRASAVIRGADTQTGIWLDAAGVAGVLRLPDTTAPFSWQVGAGTDLQAGWSLAIEDARPGLGVEVKPDTSLTIIGTGVRAAVTGELKISYTVGAERVLLDGLAPGMQNRSIGDRLVLRDVQLGPIAWQIYAGDDADVTIRHSTINEIGLFGRGARVHVEHSLLQLATLAVLGPGSVLDIRDSAMWNQNVEVANQGHVTIAGTTIYGTLFHIRDAASGITIAGGSFHANPEGCTEAAMVDIGTGQPRCNPFRTPGMPRYEGVGRPGCTGTAGCTWGPPLR